MPRGMYEMRGEGLGCDGMVHTYGVEWSGVENLI